MKETIKIVGNPIITADTDVIGDLTVTTEIFILILENIKHLAILQKQTVHEIY